MIRFSRNLLLSLAAGALLAGFGGRLAAEEAPPQYSVEFDYSADESLAPVVEKLKAVFHDCYPKMARRFQNPDRPAPARVPVVFEKGLNHPAHASGGKLTFSVEWFKQHPRDLGVIAHEGMHLIQAYRSRRNPGWLVEGIADYARALYGPKNDGWKMPERLTERNSYTQSYRVTARFLVWLDSQKPEAVDQIHRHMQKGTYRPEVWQEVTGKDLDTLWKECVASFK